jgi:glutamate/tyrosine decarboxylase-like PLP-dependent enzyme
VIRTFGVTGLKERLRNHVSWSQWLEKQVVEDPDFELMAANRFSTVILRYNPGNLNNEELNTKNKELLETINKKGEAYITHTKIGDKYVIRVNIGGTYTEYQHVEKIWNIIKNGT